MSRRALLDDMREGMADPARMTCTYHRQPGPDFAAEIDRSYRAEWITLPGTGVLAMVVLRLDGSELVRLVPEPGVDIEKLARHWAERDAMKRSPPPLPPICGPFEVVG